jgi:hypothetical protein
MTIKDLDRLVSKTDLNAGTKQALRKVRRSVQSGVVGDAVIGKASWSVSIDNEEGQPLTMNFSFKRIKDD